MIRDRYDVEQVLRGLEIRIRPSDVDDVVYAYDVRGELQAYDIKRGEVLLQRKDLGYRCLKASGLKRFVHCLKHPEYWDSYFYINNEEDK